MIYPDSIYVLCRLVDSMIRGLLSYSHITSHMRHAHHTLLTAILLLLFRTTHYSSCCIDPLSHIPLPSLNYRLNLRMLTTPIPSTLPDPLNPHHFPLSQILCVTALGGDAPRARDHHHPTSQSRLVLVVISSDALIYYGYITHTHTYIHTQTHRVCYKYIHVLK